MPRAGRSNHGMRAALGAAVRILVVAFVAVDGLSFLGPRSADRPASTEGPRANGAPSPLWNAGEERSTAEWTRLAVETAELHPAIDADRSFQATVASMRTEVALLHLTKRVLDFACIAVTLIMALMGLASFLVVRARKHFAAGLFSQGLDEVDTAWRGWLRERYRPRIEHLLQRSDAWVDSMRAQLDRLAPAASHLDQNVASWASPRATQGDGKAAVLGRPTSDRPFQGVLADSRFAGQVRLAIDALQTAAAGERQRDSLLSAYLVLAGSWDEEGAGEVAASLNRVLAARCPSVRAAAGAARPTTRIEAASQRAPGWAAPALRLGVLILTGDIRTAAPR